MKSGQQRDRRHRRAVASAVAAAVGAASVITALTVTLGESRTSNVGPTVVVADPATTPPAAPSSNPAVPSAAPTMKVPPFSGGWAGGGPFRGKGWPGP